MFKYQHVIKNTMFLYVRMIVSILANIFTTRILLDALGASDYGLYNVVGGAILMLGFLTSTMSHTSQRFISYAEGQGDLENIKSVFNNIVIVHYIVSIFLVFILICAGFIFFNGVLNIPEGRIDAALIIYICLIISTAFSVIVVPYDGILNAHENMYVYSIIGILDVFLKLIIAVCVLYSKSDRLIFYGILMALESWIIRAITKKYCKRHYEECKREELKKYYNKRKIKEFTSFAGWNLVNIASGMTSLYGRNIAVNHFFGTILNAALGIATQLSGVIMGVSANMIKAITPILVKSEANNDRNRMLNITYLGCRFSYLLFSFFCIPIIFYIDYILNLWLTEVPQSTSIFCRLLIIAHLIEQLFSFLYQTVIAQGNVKMYNIVRSIVNIMSLIASLFMFYIGYEPYWAILNWIIWYSIGGGIVNLYFSKVNVGLSVSEYWRNVLFPCLVVTIFSIILNVLIQRFFMQTNISQLYLFLMSLLLSISIYWFLGLNKKEKDLILKYIKK